MNRRWAIPILAAVFFAWNIWAYDLWAPDEPYFAEGAREMVVDGQWIVPHVNGVVTTDKPPLFFWVIALLSLPGGAVSSVTARLPSVLASVGTLLLTIRLGRRLGGERVGTYAGALLATNYLFWDKARSAQTDPLLSFLILIALSVYAGFRTNELSARRAGVVFWVAAALAVLTKGPVGFLLPLGVVVAMVALDRRPGGLRILVAGGAPLLFVGLLACWIVPASLWDPDRYTVWGALKEHFIDRAVQGMHHVQPWWYYAKVLPVQLFPWTGLVPGALVLAWKNRRFGDRFLLAIVVFFVVFFSVSTEKRDLYLLPAFPAFALLAATLLDHVRDTRLVGTSGSLSRRWVTLPQGITGILFVGLGVAIAAFGARFEFLPRWILLCMAGLFSVTGAGTALAAIRGKAMGSVAILLAGAAVTYLFAASTLYTALNPVKSARDFSLEIKRATAASRSAGHEVVACGMGNLPEAFALYSDGVYVRETEEIAGVIAHLRQPETVYAVVNEGSMVDFQDDVAERVVRVATARLAQRNIALIHNGGRATGTSR